VVGIPAVASVGSPLPWRTFVIDTCLSPALAAALLDEHIGPGREFCPASGVGTDVAGEHRFRRTLLFGAWLAIQNPFLPIIKGRLVPHGDQHAKIVLRICVSWPLAALLSAIVTCAAFAGLNGLAGAHPALVVSLVALWAIGGAEVGLASEARRARKLLLRIFASCEGAQPR